MLNTEIDDQLKKPAKLSLVIIDICDGMMEALTAFQRTRKAGA